MTYKGYLIDLDGTIYLGTKPIPAGRRFVERLQQKHIPFLFVTNNTTKKPQVVQQRLADEFGIFVDEAVIYTATLATIDYMDSRGLGKTFYAIGEAGLIESISAAGYIWNTETPDYVVVGLDSHVTYRQFELATLAVQKGALLIGTNPDKNIPTERGLVPGAGSLIALMETATQQEAVIIGKPNRYIMESALRELGLPKRDVLMVGDNYETDIQAAIQDGIDSLLVLTGFTQKEEIAGLPVAPTYVRDSLDDWQV